MVSQLVRGLRPFFHRSLYFTYTVDFYIILIYLDQCSIIIFPAHKSTIWRLPKNRGAPKSSIWIGCSSRNIHFRLPSMWFLDFPLPSGNLLQFALEATAKDSWLIYPWKMVMSHHFLYVYQRVTIQRAIPWPGAFFGSATGGLLGFTSSAVVSAACGDIVGTE